MHGQLGGDGDGRGRSHTVGTDDAGPPGHRDFVELARFNAGSVGVFRCGPYESPWEIHAHDDELLFVLEGEVVLTVLTEGDPIVATVGPGEAFVVPKGHWHKHEVAERLVELYATPGGTVHADPGVEDPREV